MANKTIQINNGADNLFTAPPPELENSIGGLGNAIGMRGWNQLVQNGDFSQGTNNWNISSVSSFTVTDNIASFTTSTTYGNILAPISLIKGHHYILGLEYKTNSSFQMGLGNGGYIAVEGVYTRLLSSNQFEYTSVIGTYDPKATFNTGAIIMGLAANAIIQIKYCMTVDLTQLFGAGNEPETVEEFRKMFPANYYPYCSGNFADLLWTNPNAAEAFLPKTLNINSTTYKFVLIATIGYKNNPINKTVSFHMINTDGTIFLYQNANNNGYRQITVNSNNIIFQDGYWLGNLDNDFIIPYQIYGIK